MYTMKTKLHNVYLANVESEAYNGLLDTGQNNIAIYKILTTVSCNNDSQISAMEATVVLINRWR